MIPRLIFAAFVTLVTTEVFASPLDDLRAEIVQWDRLSVSEMSFSGCTAPVIRTFEMNLLTNQFSVASRIRLGEESKSESPLNFSSEEVAQLGREVLLHFERAVKEKSFSERMIFAEATKDLDEMRKLQKEHPTPIGGHPALIVEIRIHRDGRVLTFSDQLGTAESCSAFKTWISEVLGKAQNQ